MRKNGKCLCAAAMAIHRDGLLGEIERIGDIVFRMAYGPDAKMGARCSIQRRRKHLYGRMPAG